jgi:nitrite reductase (NADH) large subunit
VASEQEAVWTICALTQFYREDAWYGERIYKWMDRIGLEALKAAVEDLEARKAFHDRFAYAQRFHQIDPWAERVAGRHAQEFNPLARSMELAQA